MQGVHGVGLLPRELHAVLAVPGELRHVHQQQQVRRVRGGILPARGRHVMSRVHGDHGQLRDVHQRDDVHGVCDGLHAVECHDVRRVPVRVLRHVLHDVVRVRDVRVGLHADVADQMHRVLDRHRELQHVLADGIHMHQVHVQHVHAVQLDVRDVRGCNPALLGVRQHEAEVLRALRRGVHHADDVQVHAVRDRDSTLHVVLADVILVQHVCCRLL